MMRRPYILLITIAFITLFPGCTVENSGNSSLDGALLYVSEQGWEDVGKLLLHMGANVDTRDSDLRTPLMLSAGFGHIGFVKVLVDSGAKLNLKNNENLTAMDYAARFGSTDIVAYLKKTGGG